jgi:hypothetical protein
MVRYACSSCHMPCLGPPHCVLACSLCGGQLLAEDEPVRHQAHIEPALPATVTGGFPALSLPSRTPVRRTRPRW